MPSSKGKPTDPELREELKEGMAARQLLNGTYVKYLDIDSRTAEIQQEPNKSGDGKGQWSAWKGMKLAKEYEAHGGGYENQAGSKNEPKAGKPVAKSENRKHEEMDE
jgi:hypothetical protein